MNSISWIIDLLLSKLLLFELSSFLALVFIDKLIYAYLVCSTRDLYTVIEDEQSSQSINQKEVIMKDKVQSFGRFLSGMVMPNLGAFVAWGLVTALFIPTGWLPNETFVALVGPGITYVLPLLIGYTGGRIVHGQRGAVVGAFATLGVIVGSSIPQFMGAMIIGPITAYALKAVDSALDDKVPAGFEMLVANFTAGIVAMIFAMLGQVAIGPFVEATANLLGSGAGVLVDTGLLPLVSIVVEPAKILFLNNAINHGVLSPLGLAQSAEIGKSIFFLIETNPGPGLGILLAAALFAKGAAKDNAPSAIVIHFLGGIHEIYFPYVLMNPLLLGAAIAGGMTGVFTFVLLNAGLVAPPSPGSIFALSAMASADLLKVWVGIATSTAVSFFVASVTYKFTNSTKELDDATAQSKANKG